MSFFGLFGAGGFGQEVMPIAHEFLKSQPNLKINNLQFVVDSNFINETTSSSVLSVDVFLNQPGDKYFNIAVADHILREKISKIFIEKNLKPLTIISSKSLIYESSSVAEGAIICPFSTVSANAKLGKFFHANFNCYIAHDCIIGDFVTFAPGVICNGQVIIEDNVYVGAGAIIKQSQPGRPITIGQGAVIGMGSVVTKSVKAFTVVAGNPARIM